MHDWQLNHDNGEIIIIHFTIACSFDVIILIPDFAVKDLPITLVMVLAAII